MLIATRKPARSIYTLSLLQLSKDPSAVLPPQPKGDVASPVIYGSRVYYLSSQDARETFMADPEFYVSVPSPGPAIPIRLAVVGPPKSGKSAGNFYRESLTCSKARCVGS